MENKEAQQTPEEMAAACVADQANYRQFVSNLTSPPASYNLEKPIIGGLIEALQRLNSASLELDHFKRVMTYGEKVRINPPSREHSVNPMINTARQLIADGIIPTGEVNNRLLLIHALLGKMTEAIELAPILIALLGNQSDFDAVNLLEELGDDEFYTALAHQALGIDRGVIIDKNVRKLAKRYKGGKFSATEALNRDLAVERKQLES